jgi:iron complex outermembrane receptor protein
MSDFNSKKQGTSLSNYLVRHSVQLAILAAFAAGSAAAQAQQAPVSASDEPIQEVVVTGSLIKRSAKETAEAITILSADTLKDQGITTV